MWMSAPGHFKRFVGNNICKGINPKENYNCSVLNFLLIHTTSSKIFVRFGIQFDNVLHNASNIAI